MKTNKAAVCIGRGCPFCSGDLWMCAAHPLTPLSACPCGAEDSIPCRCNPTEDLPPDFMSRWQQERRTPAPTIQ